MFVVFEGIDGAGKTTQARRLYERLKAESAKVEQVADPGTTKIGTAIRQILLHNDAPISSHAQLLLFSAARAELATYIREKLADKFTVICDRWLLSTFVYQGVINGIHDDFILNVFRQTSNLIPDMCFLLDMPSDMSAQRTGPGRDRYERVTAATRSTMRQAYLRHVGKPEAGDRTFILDALLPPEDVHKNVYNAYQSRKYAPASFST